MADHPDSPQNWFQQREYNTKGWIINKCIIQTDLALVNINFIQTEGNRLVNYLANTRSWHLMEDIVIIESTVMSTEAGV